MPYWRLFYHLISATRDRAPLFTPGLQPEIWRQLRQAAGRADIQVHAVGGMQDHVHIVVSILLSLAVADAVRRIKGGGSSRAINQQTGGGFAFQAEDGAVSVSERHLPAVTTYVTDQHERHAQDALWAPLEHIAEIEAKTQPT